MSWAEAFRDVAIATLLVLGCLGMFTDTLEVLFRGWPPPHSKEEEETEEDQE